MVKKLRYLISCGLYTCQSYITETHGLRTGRRDCELKLSDSNSTLVVFVLNVIEFKYECADRRRGATKRMLARQTETWDVQQRDEQTTFVKVAGRRWVRLVQNHVGCARNRIFLLCRHQTSRAQSNSLCLVKPCLTKIEAYIPYCSIVHGLVGVPCISGMPLTMERAWWDPRRWVGPHWRTIANGSVDRYFVAIVPYHTECGNSQWFLVPTSHT